MGLISITLPTIGDLNSTEDVDIRNALSTIQTAINGNLDANNLTNASVTLAKLAPLVLYGAINGTNGAILIAGSGGWTSSRSGAGTYGVTFSPVFSSIPVVTFTQLVGGAGTACMLTTVTASNFGCTSYTVAASPVLQDTNIFFIAIGAR